MQIYNEKIFDLMQDKRRENPLQLRDTHKGRDESAESSGTVHVRGMSVYRVYSKDEAMQLLKQGMRNRAIRATDFNSESSRSHTILQFFVSVEDVDEQGLMLLKRSTFSLVDLAGSEKWRSSLSTSTTNLQAEAAVQAQMKEMNNINTSLHVLGNCVSALIEPNRKHIPFRDSALTRLLQDPLGGNGRTILIATIHADAGHKEESYSTLQFASRASRIKVALTANVGINERANLVEAQRQIKILRAKLQEFQQGGASTGRSREGSLSPSSRRRDDSDIATINSGAVCVQCAQNDKLIAALRLKVIELHKENQALRGIPPGGPEHGAAHFRTPRKPLPSGSSSNLTKLSPSPRMHGDNSSVSSMESGAAKKKKKVPTGSKKLKRTGSKSGSRASPAVLESDREDGEDEQHEEQGLDNEESVPPLLMGISSMDPAADIDYHSPQEKERPGVVARDEPISLHRTPPTDVIEASVKPVPALTVISSPRTSIAAGRSPLAKAAANHVVNDAYQHGDSAHNLRFSDSSIEKALKAANLVLNAPPSSSLSLLNLMAQADGRSPDTSMEQGKKTKKKAKTASAPSPAAPTAVAVQPTLPTGEPISLVSPDKEYGERVEVYSPSPPRREVAHKKANPSSSLQYSMASNNAMTATDAHLASLASPFGQFDYAGASSHQNGNKSAGSTASNSFDSANLQRSVSDYLDPMASDGLMSPPMRAKTHGKGDSVTGASYASNSTASLGSLGSITHHGVGYAGSSGAGAFASTPSQQAPSRSNASNNSTPVSAPLPLLTPARKAILKSNPDACAKHGLDQCVLCQMFGSGSSSGGGGRSDPPVVSSDGGNSTGNYSYNPSSGSSSGFNNRDHSMYGNGSANQNAYDQYTYSPYQPDPNSHMAHFSGYDQNQGLVQVQQPAAQPARRKGDKEKHRAAPPSQQQEDTHGSSHDYGGSNDYGATNYVPPQSLHIPPVQAAQQWQNHSSDFSPSGIYGDTLNMVESKQHKKHQPQYPPPGAVSQPALYHEEPPRAAAEEPSECKLHGVTDCLLCQMRGVDIRKSKNAVAGIQHQQHHQHQHQQQQQGLYPAFTGNDQRGGFGSANAASAPSPLRFPAQEFISTVDPAELSDGYGFQNGPGPGLLRSQSNGSKGQYYEPRYDHQMSGSNSAPIAVQYPSLGQQYQLSSPQPLHQQQSQGAQVRKVKQISQARHQQQHQHQHEQQSPPQPNDFSYSGTGMGYPGDAAAVSQQSLHPSISMNGNSVQRVHALRQSGGSGLINPRSTSSPLPHGQQSILPSIINEYEYHNAAAGQYGGDQKQYIQQYSHPQGGGGNITYLEEETEDGEDLSDEDGADAYGQAAGGRSNPQQPVGRAVIKKKKKVKKKVTRKVPPSSGPSGATAPAVKKRF